VKPEGHKQAPRGFGVKIERLERSDGLRRLSRYVKKKMEGLRKQLNLEFKVYRRLK